MGQIKITNIKKRFASTEALKNVSLTVEEGEFSVLLGPSGCGKTTLLRIVAGLESMTSGSIILDGKDVSQLPTQKRNIAMVFQNYAVFPHMTVYQNVAFGLKMKKFAPQEIEHRVQEATELMHISALHKRLSSQLSGGQRQRVAVARALAMKPEVLLMDEPLSNLDALLRLEMRAELKELLQKTHTTTLYVTHDQTEAMSLADRIAVMYLGEIVQYADARQIYHSPATTFVGGFIGNPPMNILPIKDLADNDELSNLVKKLAKSSKVSLPLQELSLGLRAEDMPVSTSKKPGSWVVKAMVVESLGSHLHITTKIGGHLVRAVANNDISINHGQQIYLNPTNPRWFNKQGQLIS